MKDGETEPLFEENISTSVSEVYLFYACGISQPHRLPQEVRLRRSVWEFQTIPRETIFAWVRVAHN